MSNIIQQSFHIHIPVMRFLGLYPSQTHPTFQKIKGYTLLFLLLVVVVILVFVNTFCKKHNHSDTIQTNLIVTYLTQEMCMCFKSIPFIQHSEQIEKCINYFAHSRFLPRDDEERRIVKDCVQSCRRVSLVWITLLVFAVSGWLLQPLLAKDYQLPLDVWLPYNAMSGPIVFYSTFIVVSAGPLYEASIGILDPLIGGLAYHATGQFKILKYNLQNLKKHMEYKKDENSTIDFQRVSESLKRCVIHHNHILNFVAEYQKCFSFSVFCQIVGCTLAICFSCIGLILAPSGSFSTVRYATYFSILSSQILFYCYYGTLLFEENDGFIDAIYMGHWYECDIKIRKILILMMERSKRPIILTAGKIVKLTLATFVSLLKTSYSLIAVFNNY